MFKRKAFFMEILIHTVLIPLDLFSQYINSEITLKAGFAKFR